MKALGKVGIAFSKLGQHNKAIEFYTKSLHIFRELGDRAGEGNALGNLGIVFTRIGQYNKAIEVHTKHLNISRELGNRAGEGSALCDLGNVFQNLGHKSTYQPTVYRRQTLEHLLH